jgi:negative regulator of sigma-B (phosphoserine phosphatase)
MAPIEVGVAMLPMDGQATSADRHLVVTDAGPVLVAALDGLGHGKEAERAAVAAVQTLQEAPADSLIELVTRCHARLRETRGVVMSLASLDLDRGILTWLGVGNVTGVLLRNRPDGSFRSEESLVLRGGVVGRQLPPLQSSSFPLASGDSLVFATDGVGPAFEHERWSTVQPQRLAEQILARHGKGTDDALVLVVRYQGGAES